MADRPAVTHESLALGEQGSNQTAGQGEVAENLPPSSGSTERATASAGLPAAGQRPAVAISRAMSAVPQRTRALVPTSMAVPVPQRSSTAALPTMSFTTVGSADGVTVEQLLEVLDRVKGEIIADIRREHGELQKALAEKIALLSTVMDKIHTCVAQTAIEARTRHTLSPPSKKRAVYVPDHIDILTNPEQCIDEHLSLVFVLTVVAFALQNTQFQPWIDAQTKIKLAKDVEKLKKTSGICIIFFGSVKELGVRKFQTVVAEVWSLALRWVLAKKLSATKRHLVEEAVRLGRPPTSQIPDWLASFGNATQSVVDTVINDEHNTLGEFTPIGQIDSSSTNSQMAVVAGASGHIGQPVAAASTTSSGEGQSTRRRESKREEIRRKMGLSAKPTDPVAEARVSAVLNMRSRFMTKLATGRNEARKILYQDIFFLVDKISEYASAVEAEMDGYFFELNGENAPCNANAEEISPTYLWNIPLAEGPTPGMAETNVKELNARNIESFENLQTDFPWLHVTLNNKRKVLEAPHGQQLHMSESFSFPLHKAAGDLIHACYKLPEFEEVLYSSALSLRGIHIHAVSLYAALRKLCGYDLGDLEKSAMGHLTWKYLSGGRNSEAGHGKFSRGAKGYVTAMYGAGVQSEAFNEDKTSLLHKYRHEKFSIPWAEYQSETARRRAENRVESVRSQSVFASQSQPTLYAAGDSDWPKSAGAA